MTSKLSAAAAMAILAFFATHTAEAVESGSSPISAGAEGYLTAIAPPPGVYWLGYTVNYRSTRLNDNNATTG